MADEAFALSPISARAAQPSEADYDAIKEAFMETSRGRWFLGEYAKRNRNTDTLQVLEAVARIEETLTAQKKPARDPALDAALAAIRVALGEAKGATQAALGHLSFEQNLPPIRKGARVIREIAWRLREIGADGRICDLIDSQVSAIEGAAAKMAPADLASALGGVFDLVEARIASFDADDTETSASPPVNAAWSDAPDEAIAPAVGIKAEDAMAPASPGEVAAKAPEAFQPTDGETLAEAAISDPIVAAEQVTAAAPEEGEPVDAFNAEDEAVLDMVAMEMAAPDTDDAYVPPMDAMSDDETGEYRSAVTEAATSPAPPPAPPSLPPAPVAEKTETIPVDDIEFTFVSDGNEPPAEAAIAEPVAAAPVERPTEAAPVIAAQASAPSVQVTPQADAAPSLGSSLLANGIVQRPKISKADPFAPLRRMTQSEKIAFFS